MLHRSQPFSPVVASSVAVWASLLALGSARAQGGEEAVRLTTTLPPWEVEQRLLDAAPQSVEALARVAAAEADVHAARRLPDPVVEIGGSASGTKPWSDPLSRALIGGVEWEVATPWRWRSGVRLADAQLRAAHVGAAATRVELRRRVGALVVDLLAAQESAKVAEQQREVAAQLAKLTAARVDSGEGRELERLRAQAELVLAEQRADASRREVDALSSILVHLSGGALPEGVRVAGVLPANLPAVDGGRIVEVALASSPWVLTAAKEIEVARAADAVARADRSPSLIARAADDAETDSRTASVTLALRVPLWNANRWGIAAARARVRAAEAHLEGTRRNIAGQVTAAAGRFAAARAAAMRSSTDVVPAARVAHALALLSFSQGETPLLEVLDAQRSLHLAQQADVELRRALHLLRGELDALTGRDVIESAAAQANRDGSDAERDKTALVPKERER